MKKHIQDFNRFSVNENQDSKTDEIAYKLMKAFYSLEPEEMLYIMKNWGDVWRKAMDELDRTIYAMVEDGEFSGVKTLKDAKQALRETK